MTEFEFAPIRPLNVSDIDEAVELNNAEIPHVGPTDPEHLARFLTYPGLVWVAEDEDGLVGLLVACEPGSGYGSTNYRWFDEHFDDFIYVDRIVVAHRVKGRGFGRHLYERLASTYLGVARQMTCEVNIDPPNETSMAFHFRMGFAPVGTQPIGSKIVALLAKPLA